MVSVAKAIPKFNHGLIGLIEVARAKEKLYLFMVL